MNSEKSVSLSRFGLRPWWVVAILFTCYVSVRLVTGSTVENVLSQVPVDDGSEASGNVRAGYDGLFTYFIAVDPIHASPHLDVPPYRMQRILLPLVGFFLSFGQTALVPWALLAVNSVALIGGVWFLEQFLEVSGTNRWYAIIYGLTPGIFLSASLSLTEPLAYGLVILGVVLDRNGKPVSSAAAFALALLTKETTLGFVLGYLLWMGVNRQWRDLLRLGLISCIPFIIWQIVLVLWLGSPGIGSGGEGSTPFEIIPYASFVQAARLYHVADPFQAGDSFTVGYILIAFLIAIFPSLCGIVRGGFDLLRKDSTAASGLLLANAAMIAILPLSTSAEIGGLLRFIPGLTLSFLLYGALTGHRRMLLYSWVWLALAVIAVLA